MYVNADPYPAVCGSRNPYGYHHGVLPSGFGTR